VDASATIGFVAPESPAERAGLLPGDVIRSLPDRRILSESDFHLTLIDRKPGDVLTLRVLRVREARLCRLTLGEGRRPNPERMLARLGLKVVPLDRTGAVRIGLRVAKGAVLTQVQEEMFPDNEKPQPGDVLASINGFHPEDMDHIGRLLAETQPGHSIHLVFLRKRDTSVSRIDVKVTPPTR
jgi:serine protease Do